MKRGGLSVRGQNRTKKDGNENISLYEHEGGGAPFLLRKGGQLYKKRLPSANQEPIGAFFKKFVEPSDSTVSRQEGLRESESEKYLLRTRRSKSLL